MTALLVALAGGVGSVLRFAANRLVPARGAMPWPTLLVNVTGSFALGALVGASAANQVLTVVGIGLLGGFTTFSAASAEAAEAWHDGQRLRAVTLATVMLVVCVVAAAAGHAALS